MILSFAAGSPHAPLWRKVGLNAPSPVTIEKRRIKSNGSGHFDYCKEYSSVQYSTRSSIIRASSGGGNAREIEKQQVLFSSTNYSPSNNVPRLKLLLNAFYEFCRPYAMLGTGISVISISLLPLTSLSEVSSSLLVEVMKVLVLFLLMQFYVGGINQIYDVEVDKVNKPYLPLASGIFSMQFGITIVAMSILLCLALGIMLQSPPLLLGILVYFVVGSAYSVELPFMRWKGSPFLSILYMVVVRAVVIPFATFIHIQKHVLGRPIILPGSLIFTSVFACFFSIVIALSKDIPDIDGDRQFGFESLLAVRLGKERVFRLCICVLMVIYGCAMGIGFSSSLLLSKLVTVSGHFLLASIVLQQALRTDLSVDSGAGFDFYMVVWKLMYAEYFLIHFVR